MADKALRDFVRSHMTAQADAAEDFAKRVAEILGSSIEDGRKVFAIYEKGRCVKFDRCNRRYTVAHGGLWDAGILRRAAALDAPIRD